MAKKVTRYDLLISCPGDAAGVVGIIKSVVEEFNQQFSDALGIDIRCRYWKDSAYAESGGKPQDLLNKQIVIPSDLAVAVFKNRFGSPTDKYGSGTEEEIEKMLSEGKQVFVFFDETPVKLSEIDLNEYEKVQDFKERYKDKGIFWLFSSEEEFRKLFRAHITQFFMALSNDGDEESKSNLVIRSCRNGKIEEEVRLSAFDMGKFISSERLRTQLKEKIEHIKNNKILKSTIPEQPIKIFAGKRVEIDNRTKEIIKAVSQTLEISIDDVFFDVGNITESPWISSMPFGGVELSGTSEEKAKYKAIISLSEMIYTTLDHLQIEEYYKDLFGIEFLLCNDGTKFDEDIDVEITIPKERYISVEELPVPTEELKLGDDWCFADIFEITATKDFISYNDSKKPLTGIKTKPYIPVNPFSGRNYEEEYRDTLRDIFEYQVYPDGDNVIIKVHFDYIKQHQIVAFPAWIFIKDPNDELEVKYRIISKNNRDIIESQTHVNPYTY